MAFLIICACLSLSDGGESPLRGQSLFTCLQHFPHDLTQLGVGKQYLDCYMVTYHMFKVLSLFIGAFTSCFSSILLPANQKTPSGTGCLSGEGGHSDVTADG